jgi:hypothetical protein
MLDTGFQYSGINVNVIWSRKSSGMLLYEKYTIRFPLIAPVEILVGNSGLLDMVFEPIITRLTETCAPSKTTGETYILNFFIDFMKIDPTVDVLLTSSITNF